MANASLAALLALHFTIFNYGCRGDSGDTTPYAVGREIEDIHAVITATGGSASVYGTSSGAVLADPQGAAFSVSKVTVGGP